MLAVSQEQSSINKVAAMNFTYGGGGGGGGTFVFLVSCVHFLYILVKQCVWHKLKTGVLQVNQDNESVPLIVASGGGGLSQSRSNDDWSQHGHGLKASRLDTTGNEFGVGAAGRMNFSEYVCSSVFQMVVYKTMGFHKVKIWVLHNISLQYKNCI
jgi:hypothetical protein